MALIKGEIKNDLAILVRDLNNKTQEDKDQAIDNFCDKIESVIYKAIRNFTFTIPPGDIITTGSPTTQTNAIPIVINRGAS